MPHTRRLFLSTLAALGAAAMLPWATPARADAPVSVVATTGMIADAARRVGGDHVAVRALMGPGVDPHAYRQTRTDIVALAQADLVLWHGLYLEAQMEPFLLDLARDRAVVAVAEDLPADRLLVNADYPDRADPHVWMDPQLWAGVVSRVQGALAEVAPQHADAFAANAEAHLAELAALDTYARGVLGSVPEDRRVLVTAHDAFAYFGRAYRFDVLGIQGISTESEAGLRRISELVDLIVERGIGAVFVETSVSDRNIRALVEGAAAQGHTVAIGGELYSDAMGPEGSYEGTYVGMIDHNVSTIARALGGDVPARGMQDRLN
jgi:manganese/zinc/iron transport system substrate-binding protein